MKISLVGPVYPYRGGISHFTSSLARAFLELNVDLQVISFKRQYPKWLYPGESDLDPSAVHESVQAEFILDPFWPVTWWKAIRAIHAFNSRIVVIEWWTVFWGPAYFMVTKFLHRHGLKVIFLIHNVLPHEEKPWDRLLTKLVLRQGDGYLVQTERERDRLFELIGHQDCIRVQPHPIYKFNLTENLTQQEARLKLGLPSKIPVILFFGIVRPYKGLNILLKALSILNQTNEYYLLIAGEFWQDKAEYLSQIKQLGIQHKVKIIDHYIPNEDLPIIFTAADVFTAAYLEGTQSGTTSLALGFGSRVVVSDRVARGIPENIISFVEIVPSGDPLALATGIQKAIAKTGQGQIQMLVGEDWRELARGLINLGGDNR
jgi:glycosyltransferase involved in cell wall biosynthesis